jgi:glycosyltransferase involved in cell wall biosynthesis
MKVLALTASSELTGPCRSLFQLVEHTRPYGVEFVLGMFLLAQYPSSLAIDEAKRRGYCVEVLTQRRRYDPALLRQVSRLIRRDGISVLQSHGYKAALIAWCLHRVTGIPWVALAEGYTSENRRMALYNRLDRWLLRRADRVVAVSQATGEFLHAHRVPPERMTVIANAVDADDYQLDAERHTLREIWQIHTDDLLIGVVGRFSPEKGHAVFIRSFKQVLKHVPRAHAVLVGEGLEEASLRELVRAEGLEERVHFVGYHCAMSPVFAALDLVVIPSLNEGIPLVLLEALLHGKAVVATCSGGMPEVLTGELARWLVRPTDSDALAEAQVQALQDESLRIEFGKAGARHVSQQFSSARRAAHMLAVYQQVTMPTFSTTGPRLSSHVRVESPGRNAANEIDRRRNESKWTCETPDQVERL